MSALSENRSAPRLCRPVAPAILAALALLSFCAVLPGALLSGGGPATPGIASAQDQATTQGDVEGEKIGEGDREAPPETSPEHDEEGTGGFPVLAVALILIAAAAITFAIMWARNRGRS